MTPEEFQRTGEAIKYAKAAVTMGAIAGYLDDSWEHLEKKKAIWADQERKAWAWAVRKARGVQRAYGVDLLFPWGKGSDVFDEIYENLEVTEAFSRFLPGGQIFTRGKR